MKKKVSLLLIVLWTWSAYAIDKPTVAVRFKIEATAYPDHFGASVGNIEQRAAEVLTQSLKQHIQFADFTSDGSSAPYTLTVSLAVRDAHTDVAAQPVWLMASLASASGASSKSRWQKCREAAANCGGLSDR